MDEAEAETEGVVAEEEADKISSRVQAPLQPLLLLVTKAPNIQIFRLVSGMDAQCIINSGNKVTFVQSQEHAHGKMCLRQDQTNETGTSPLTSN